jgi:RNA recognition motif-containing protein
LYVGNLSYDTSNSDLESLFSQFGTVKTAQVVSDTGRSKGFAFVEMTNDTDAKSAIEGLVLKEIGGRCLTVNEARPREERSRGAGSTYRGGAGGRGRGGRY